MFSLFDTHISGNIMFAYIMMFYGINMLLSHCRFLKSVLQYTENMAILTGPDKNKWDECCKLTTAMVEKVYSFFTKWHQM